MQKLSILIILLFALVVAACGSSIPTNTQPANDTKNPNQGPRPTPTSDNRASESTEPGAPYPGVPPTVTPYPEGYPALREIPTLDPYPANTDTVWVLHPVGVQCEDAAGSKYQSEQDVVAGFTAAGITVHEVTTTELMVCTACGCPTSIHYRAEINAADLGKAEALGWEAEEG